MDKTAVLSRTADGFAGERQKILPADKFRLYFRTRIRYNTRDTYEAYIFRLMTVIFPYKVDYRRFCGSHKYALVAQLDRVSDSDSEGRWFESSQARQ